MDWAIRLKIVLLIATVKIATSFPQNKDDLQERIWVESTSGTMGWALNAGQCQKNVHLSNPNPFHQWKPNCGDYPPDLIQRRWHLPLERMINKSSEDRSKEGIVLSVINSRKGNLILNKVFPLWQYWAHWGDLQWYMNRIESGRLVIISVSVTGTLGLRNATVTLKQMGSLLAHHLTPTSHWSWVFIKGGKTISEAAVLHTKTGVHLHTQLVLNYLRQHYSTLSDKERWSYCETVGGMGELCEEYNPVTLLIPKAPALDNESSRVIDGVPVILSAGNRHQYLYYTLTTLLAAHGSKRNNILVVLGNAPNSTTQLLDLLNINYTTISINDNTNSALYKYYRRVYQLVIGRFKNAPAAIFLDEDVEISKDFFSYMSQTLGILYKDPTLYCINGFSAFGGPGMIQDARKVLRGSVQVEWGYALTLDFIREAISKWKLQGANTLLYDFYLYTNVRGDRECIFPEKSRARHYGMGVNTAVDLMELSNFNIEMVKKAPVKIQSVENLEVKKWHLHLAHKIKHAMPIVKNPCHPSFLPQPPYYYSYYVFYYRLDSLEYNRPDYYQYHHPNDCLGLWASSEQGHHEGVTIVHIANETYLYLVGVPYSSYSYLKPHDVPLWDVDAIPDDDFNLMVNQTMRKRQTVISNLNTTKEQVMVEFGVKL